MSSVTSVLASMPLSAEAAPGLPVAKEKRGLEFAAVSRALAGFLSSGLENMLNFYRRIAHCHTC
jgi:hypothetical protein